LSPDYTGIEECREGQVDGQTMQQSMAESQAFELCDVTWSC
jgi:hypothetical protein